MHHNVNVKVNDDLDFVHVSYVDINEIRRMIACILESIANHNVISIKWENVRTKLPQIIQPNVCMCLLNQHLFLFYVGIWSY